MSAFVWPNWSPDAIATSSPRVPAATAGGCCTALAWGLTCPLISVFPYTAGISGTVHWERPITACFVHSISSDALCITETFQFGSKTISVSLLLSALANSSCHPAFSQPDHGRAYEKKVRAGHRSGASQMRSKSAQTHRQDHCY